MAGDRRRGNSGGGGALAGEERGGYGERGSQQSSGYGSYSTSKVGSGSGGRERDGNAWSNSRHNGSAQGAPPQPAAVDKNLGISAALRGMDEATEPTEWALRCAAAVLDAAASSRSQCEVVLAKLNNWLGPPSDPQVLSQFASSAVPGAVVRVIRKFRNEPLAAALCCVTLVRSSGCSECASIYLRAGALEEVGGLMDRHPNHGGIQNVGLLVLCGLVKDSVAARQAVSLGATARVLRAMEAIAGREVQFNGLSALRLLTEQGRAQRAGLQEAALRAKVAHQSDSTVGTVADDVLALVTPRFKEVLCWHWQSGWCKLGPRCTYAHGPADLRSH